MHIIYHCYGGAHSSVTAASIHLGLIAPHTVPSAREIQSLPDFDQPTEKEHGYLRLMGRDKKGNHIYVIGRRGLKNCFDTLVNSLVQNWGIPLDNLLIVDTVTCVNWVMMIGGYASRRLGWVPLGRPLVTVGIQLAYHNFVHLVAQVQKQAQGAVTH